MRPVIRARFRPGAARSGHKRLTCRFSLKTEKSTAMKKMFVTVACALLSLAAFAQQSVKSDEGKPLVFSKAEFVGGVILISSSVTLVMLGRQVQAIARRFQRKAA